MGKNGIQKKNLSIAMFGQKRIPSREGGVEVVVEELSTRMARRGHRIVCYNRAGHHVSGKEFDARSLSEYQGVRLKSVFTLNRKGLAAVTSSISAAICCCFGKYDIVHIHAEGPAFLCWLPKLFGKRIVVTVHGLDHKRAKWGKLASTYIMQGERNAVQYADEIIVLSEGVKQYFKTAYNRDTVFIPNGVSRPMKVEAEEITRLYGLKKDQYVLFLGRIVPEKGLSYLLDAYAQLRTDKKLVIAGGSSDTQGFLNDLQRRSENDKRIVFTGFVQGRVLGELYSNAYCYVLPSDLEGMPLSLLEAMSYGNCCVTSDIPECAEVVEDKALTFPRGNVDALAETLQMLVDNKKTVEEYRECAADFICKKYNWEHVVDKTIALYRGNDE